jgi:ABC-type Fe3+/spermidine/putrescine transport system ATPase subunit
VFVTHDQEEALSMSDRIAVMNGGSVEQVGAPSDIYDHPRTAFVAGFVGLSNLMAGRVEHAAVRLDSGQWGPVAAGALDGRSNGEGVVISVRPERLVLTAGEDGAGLPGEVVDAVYLGATTQYGVRCGDRRLTVLESNIGAQRATARSPGDRVSVTWVPEDAVVMDA